MLPPPLIFINRTLKILCCCIVLIAAGRAAHAQSIDYGSLEELFGEPVITSATGKPQRVSEVPVAMEIITAEDIRHSGATSIPEILRRLAGVNMLQWSRTDFDVGIRGYNQPYSPRLLVLVNGRQVYVNIFNYTAWETIPVQLEEIRQIEVVKGPNTALFGFNAVGGVVNIITYNPAYDDVSGVGVRVGTDKARHAHALYTLKGGDLGIRLSGDVSRSDQFNSDPASSIFRDPHRSALNFDGVMQLNDSSQIRLELSRSQVGIGEVTPGHAYINSAYNVKSAKATYMADTDIGLIDITAYRNLLTQDSSVGIVDNITTVVQASDLFQIGSRHSIRLQGEYRENTITSPEFFGAGGRLGYSVASASGMWHWALRDNLSWTNAVRGDYLVLGRSGTPRAAAYMDNDNFDQSITAYSYNSGLVWQPDETNTIRLSIARGIQSPSLIEFGMEFLGSPPLIITGNPYIDPSVISNYEIGYDRKINEINGAAHMAVFYQSTRDIKNTTEIAAFPVYTAGNIGDSKSVGMEISLEGRFQESWHWGANYTYQVIEDDLHINTGGGPVFVADYDAEDTTPSHMFNANLGYESGPWEADGYLGYVSGYKSFEALMAGGYSQVDVPGYVTAGARLAYKINDNVTIALSGQNLGYEASRRTAGPEVERQVFLSLTSSF